MTSRSQRYAATTLATGLLAALGACSGSSEPAPLADPTSSTDDDGYTAQERAAVDAVDAYADALVTYQKGDRDVDLSSVATDEVAGGIVNGVKNSLDDEGLVMIGDYTLTVDSVSVTGDTASVGACNDGSALFLVPEGEDVPGVGSQQLQETALTYELTRQSKSWVVSAITSEETGC